MDANRTSDAMDVFFMVFFVSNGWDSIVKKPHRVVGVILLCNLMFVETHLTAGLKSV